MDNLHARAVFFVADAGSQWLLWRVDQVRNQRRLVAHAKTQGRKGTEN
jgi:hypothetical protein